MITCAVCGTQNSELATVCSACKGYVQTKVDVLDLFSTMWGIIESPHKTFHRIALAKTKTYTFFLSMVLGCATAFAIIWYRNLGSEFDGLAQIAAAGIVSGPFLGISLAGLLAFVATRAAKLLGGTPSVRNSMAAIAYAGIPIIIAFVLIFPIEIALFGKYLFDVNPSPRVLNPLAYFVLTGLDAAGVIWSILLTGIAIAKANLLPLSRGYAVTGILVALGYGLTALAQGIWG